MKKILVGILIGSLLTIGATKIINNNNNKIKIERVITESEDGWYVSPGEKIILLNNGSWVNINEDESHYEFQPVELGDWSYEVDNYSQLKNLVETYYNIKLTGQY